MKVQLSIPTRGTIRIELVLYLLNVLQSEFHHKLELGFMDAQPYANARAHIVRKFLSGDAEWLWMLDDDVVPHGNMLNYITEDFDLDVVGLSCPIYKDNVIAWSAGEPNGKFVEVDHVGAGCVLIARRVLEVVQTPFLEVWNNDGTLALGEDLAFCDRIKNETQFKIWRAPFGGEHFRIVPLAVAGGLV